MPSWYHWQAEDLHLNLRIQPKASKDEFAGLHGDCMKVRLTAPPVDGQANRHLIKFLAKAFKVPQAQVRLVSGESGRLKRLIIHAPRQLPECIR